MNSKRLILAGLLLVVAMGSVFANGTGEAAAAAGTENGGSSVLVGDPSEQYYMVTFTSGQDYWKSCYEGFQEAGAQFGIETQYAGDPTPDVAKQVTVFDQVAARRPMGIAVTCANAEAMRESINRAVADGIAVVTFDSDSPDSDRATYLATGNAAAGEEAAKYLASIMPDGGNVALLYLVGAENSEARAQGFEDWTIANPESGLKVVAKVNDRGEQTEAARNMSAQLQADPSITAIVCLDSPASLAAPTVVQEAGRTDITIVTFDTDTAILDMIKNGQIAATLAQGTYNMGYLSMKFLYDMAHDLPAKALPSYIDTGITIVTAENADEYYM